MAATVRMPIRSGQTAEMCRVAIGLFYDDLICHTVSQHNAPTRTPYTERP